MSHSTVTPVEDLTLADFTTSRDADIKFEFDGPDLIITAFRSWSIDVSEDYIPEDIRVSEDFGGAAKAAFQTLHYLTGREWLGEEADDFATELVKATDHMGEPIVQRVKEILTSAFHAIRVADKIVNDLAVPPAAADYSAEPDMVGIR